MNETMLAVFGLGFTLGLRHALEPDHVAAVSTIVSGSSSIARSSIAGTIWGVGHTTSLFLCGIAVLALRLSIGENFIAWTETAVAVMLIVLGLNALRRWMRHWTMHIHRHSHGGRSHVHFHVHRVEEVALHDHVHVSGIHGRSFFVGMLHGLAGSGALMVLVLATVPSIVGGLVYILLFGLGSIGGMMLLSTLITIPFAVSARRYRLFNHCLQIVAALISIGLGIFWMSQHGLV